MNNFFKKVNKIVNKVLPYTLILLLIIIIAEMFFDIQNENIILAIKISDGFIIAVFVLDLAFLYYKSKNLIFFFKNYWLDILAVLPLGLMFRVGENIFKIGAEAEKIFIGQRVLHEVAQAEKLIKFTSKLEEGAKIFRFLEEFAKVFRFIPKTIDYIKGTDLFTKLYYSYRDEKTNYDGIRKYGKI